MNSNIVEFFKTRKFWTPIVAFAQMALVHLLVSALKIEVTPEIILFIDAAIWSIAGVIVAGDVGYDWKTVENETPAPVLVEKG
jgi:hypothetical protein